MPALELNMTRGRFWQGSLKDIYILGLTLEMSNGFFLLGIQSFEGDFFKILTKIP